MSVKEGTSHAEDIWNGTGGNNKATIGPLAYTSADDFSKLALSTGGDTSYDSPGNNFGNTQQRNPGSGINNSIVQDKDSARGGPPEKEQKKPTAAPTKGTVGGDAIRRMRAKSKDSAASTNASGDSGSDETVTKSVGDKHNLIVKEDAPVPKEVVPSNLPTWEGTSSFTGSGPLAQLHSKAASSELFDGVADLAGIPEGSMAQGSFLGSCVSGVADAEMSKVASLSETVERGDVHPIKIVAELTDAMGDEWVEWEPETIFETITKESGVQPSDDLMSKIMAMKVVLAAPQRFYEDWHAMEKISVALNDVSPTMGTAEDVPIEWLSNAVSIVEKLAAPSDFSPEVAKYVAARLHEQGYVLPPPKLAFANQELSGLVQNPALQKKVLAAYTKALSSSDNFEDKTETAVNIQVARLMRNHTHVLEKLYK